jgi:hypothetical protein
VSILANISINLGVVLCKGLGSLAGNSLCRV